ncbi:MAG: hypothetical protein ABI443_07815 [Chthoniobacterales bacterium]
MAKNRRRNNKRLDATAAARTTVIPTHVPKRWVKFVVAIFLMPLAWVLTETFFTMFAHTTVEDQFWRTEEFYFFALGCVLWIIAFVGLPRPMWIYVFGHELTHAMVVWLIGGEVSRFEVSAKGGHVITNRVNTWVALAPYFVPIYSILSIVLWGWVSLIYDLSSFREALFALIGAGWAFHLTFTIIMIPKGQTDLEYGGHFFSLMVIYIMNLCVMTVLVIIASPKVTWMGFGRDFFHNTVDFCVMAMSLLRHIPLHLPGGA